ncbi:MAG: cell envelope-related transcriptional attenuator [Cyanobacteria bacterium RYN_339]|nr:cell envelope-related transcriptional attenuator [Cyanobacteria bacterium RYN_339]
MPPRRPRSATPTGPLHGYNVETQPMEDPRPRSTTTGRLRLPPSRRRKALRVRNFLRTVALGGLMMGLGAVTAVAGVFGYLTTFGPASGHGFSAGDLAQGLVPISGRENVLLMGTDFSYDNGQKLAQGPVRSDTMMVASVDPATHKLTIVSIPRDTRVLIRGHYEKVNGAYAIGGPKLATEVVSNLLGVPIKHWAQVNTTGLERLVDVIGGVKVYVEKDMYYVDETAHLGINIHKGWHQMSGKQAHQYVRFRHDELGDIGRVQRQQQFLRAAAETMLTPSSLLKVPQLMGTVRDNIATNLGTPEIMQLGAWAARLNRQDVKMVMLPGEFSQNPNASYWLVDPQAAQTLGRRLLAGATESQWRLPDRQKVKLTVLNGTSLPGVASAAARELREAGWNVWSVGDASQRDVRQTRVINQLGQDQLAVRIGHDLGIRPERVDASVGDMTTDFTVIVGADWAHSHASKIALKP